MNLEPLKEGRCSQGPQICRGAVAGLDVLRAFQPGRLWSLGNQDIARIITGLPKPTGRG